MSQTHAFVEKVFFDELESDKQIFTIDINKCCKSIFYYGEFDYYVLTVIDKIDEFKESTIQFVKDQEHRMGQYITKNY